MAEARKCSQCGAPISDGAKECKYCGHVFNTSKPEKEVTSSRANNVEINPHEFISQYKKRVFVPNKNQILAAALAFFFGTFGAHKFYLGKIGQGILYIIFFWTAIPTIVSIFEALVYLFTPKMIFAQKYGGHYIEVSINNL